MRRWYASPCSPARQLAGAAPGARTTTAAAAFGALEASAHRRHPSPSIPWAEHSSNASWMDGRLPRLGGLDELILQMTRQIRKIPHLTKRMLRPQSKRRRSAAHCNTCLHCPVQSPPCGFASREACHLSDNFARDANPIPEPFLLLLSWCLWVV